jgi:hypothetical protein
LASGPRGTAHPSSVNATLDGDSLDADLIRIGFAQAVLVALETPERGAVAVDGDPVHPGTDLQRGGRLAGSSGQFSAGGAEGGVKVKPAGTRIPRGL